MVVAGKELRNMSKSREEQGQEADDNRDIRPAGSGVLGRQEVFWKEPVAMQNSFFFISSNGGNRHCQITEWS